MKLSMSLDLFVALCAAGLFSGVAQAELEATVGFRASDKTFESQADVMIPILQSENSVLFLNPRGAGDDDGERELNVGLGLRTLVLDERLLLGVNGYYDARWTRHDNQFNQGGVGVELLTSWVDARANVYVAENERKLADSYTIEEVSVRDGGQSWDDDVELLGTSFVQRGVWRQSITTIGRTYEKHEQARDGWDAELGVRLPLGARLPETRVFGGYYNWDAAYVGGEDIEGLKARLEVRLSSMVALDAGWFEDEELDGSNWYAGCRVSTAFDLAALVRGENPFRPPAGEEQPSGLKRRLLEMVQRDLKIRTEEDEFEENLDKLTVETDVVEVPLVVYIEPYVYFVRQAPLVGTRDGSLMKPFYWISEAMAALRGHESEGRVFVMGSYTMNDPVPALVISSRTLVGDFPTYDGTYLLFVKGKYDKVKYTGELPDWIKIVPSTDPAEDDSGTPAVSPPDDLD